MWNLPPKYFVMRHFKQIAKNSAVNLRPTTYCLQLAFCCIYFIMCLFILISPHPSILFFMHFKGCYRHHYIKESALHHSLYSFLFFKDFMQL